MAFPFNVQGAAFGVVRGASYAPSMPGYAGALLNLVKLSASMVIIISHEYQRVQQEIREAENNFERMIMKHELRILAKKEEIFRELEHLAVMRVPHINIPAITQKIALCGQQLIRLEETKEGLEQRKEKIRRGGVRGHFSNISTWFWMRKELKQLEAPEEREDLAEEHIIKILETALIYIEREDLKTHPQTAGHIRNIIRLLRELESLTVAEARDELGEERFENK